METINHASHIPAPAGDVTSRAYEERVYAGVLGKIIGVYLGRPFEGWSHERIERELGEIAYYVHEQRGFPLVVTDDDISGTFTFVRALSENGNNPNLTAAQIGDWWLNTAIENRAIFWWGGLGMSTEHTAFLRLKSGLKAPASGSIATNGSIVAEQIGAQIFIDGWAMVNPGDPERAAHFAGLAASVSHDGEAIYGAQVVAAMEAQAFVESDLNILLDTAASLIPRDSTIYRLMGDMRAWASANGDNWRATLKQIHARYGYDKFTGACHMVPNHAIILLGLLHGNDDFQRSLMIANTAGWDTDCNSGNVGCLMGIKNGLAGIDSGPDWRGPVADRLFLPTADGGRSITDAVRETYELVNSVRALAGQPPAAPKDGARFHFSLPGSVQAFAPEDSPEMRGAASVSNTDGRLSLHLTQVTPEHPARVATATFISPDALRRGGYSFIASPTLYSGQTVTAQVQAENISGQAQAGLYARVYADNNELSLLRGPTQTLASGGEAMLSWTVPETGGQPIAEIGIEFSSAETVSGDVLLDFLTWNGTPRVAFGRTEKGDVWQRAWVNAVSHFHGIGAPSGMAYRLIHDEGIGTATQGEFSWADYTVTATVLPHLADRVGLMACVRGLRRYIALILDRDKTVRLIEQEDDQRRVLAEFHATWEYEQPANISLTITGGRIIGRYGEETVTALGNDLPRRGAIGLLVDNGHAEFGDVAVRPA